MFSEELVWVQTESLLTLLILLGLLLALLGTRRGADGSLPTRWAVPLGVALGLAFGTKLTAGFSLAAVAAWMVAVGLAAALRDPGRRVAPFRSETGSRVTWRDGESQPAEVPPPPLAARLRFALSAARGWLVALGIGLGVFVLSNPHLYPNPIVHTGHLFSALDEYMQQWSADDQLALPSVVDRIEFVLRVSTLLGLSSTTWQGSLVDKAVAIGTGLIAALGLGALCIKAFNTFRSGRAMPWEAIALLTVFVYFLGVSAGIELGRPRYVVAPALLSTVLFGVGVGAVSRPLAGFAAHPPRARELLGRIGRRSELPPPKVVDTKPNAGILRP